MSSKVYWVFYDSLSKFQSNPVSTEEAQIMIFKMRPPQMARFYVWTTGWQSWQPLRSYLESDQKNFVSTFTVPVPAPIGEETIKATVKDVLENTQTKTNFKISKDETKSFSSIRLDEETVSRIIRQENVDKHSSFNGEEITWSNIQKPNLDFSHLQQNKQMSRREPRHELKIEVLLISSKGKTFRSRSKNISLSGSLLEDTIPFDYYDIAFDVIVINNHTKDPSKSRVKMQARTVGDGLTQRIHYQDPTEQQKKSLQSLLEDYLEVQKRSLSKAG